LCMSNSSIICSICVIILPLAHVIMTRMI
jgi:hypothetical protein